MDIPTAARSDVLPRVRSQLTKTGYLTNGVGATVVVAFMLWFGPSTLARPQVRSIAERSLPVFIVFMLVFLPLGNYLIERRPLVPIERWLRDGRPANQDDRVAILRYPRQWAVRSFKIWAAGALTFGLVNINSTVFGAIDGALTIVLGALTACSLQYVLVERIMRPITELALASGLPRQPDVPGVGSRLTMAWLLTTGVPLLGIAVFAIAGLSNSHFDRGRVVAAALFLAAVGLSVGMLAMLVTASSVSEPLRSMRDALARVEAGDLTTRVAVDDGSEVGMLQAGFNLMTTGLAERQQLRDAFGTFVDAGLTERILREGTDLAGEEVELSVLFMDVRDFTAYAESATPQAVVARLNDLYGAVVPVVLRHRGHANKFIGDGLLAVFGAPDRLPDHATCAVAAALEIVDLVNARYCGNVRVGVGVNSGRVVAGTIGGGGRLDFTVIGDPVNTAARVESATRQTGDDVLITEHTLALLDGTGAGAGWVERPAIELKGKERVVRLYACGRSPGESLPARSPADRVT